MLLVAWVVAGHLLAARAASAPDTAGDTESQGFSTPWLNWNWELPGSNLALVKIVEPAIYPEPRGANDPLPNYRAMVEILGDVFHRFKPGEHIEVDVQYKHDKGAIVLQGVMLPQLPSNAYASWYGKSPIGWSAGIAIPPERVPAVKAALETLHSVFTGKPTDRPNHAKALSFMKAEDYETWAIGASLLAAEQPHANEEILMKVFEDPNTDISRALWIYECLEVGDLDDALKQYMDDHSVQLREVPRAIGPKNGVSLNSVPAPAETSVSLTRVPPAVRLMGASFWKRDADLLVVKIATVEREHPAGDSHLLRGLEVLADVRGRYAAGVRLTMAGKASDATRWGIPSLDNGTVVLLPVVAGTERGTVTYVSGVCAPVGWRVPQSIPPDSVKGVTNGLATLRSILPKNVDDPLDHAKALELFNSTNYETWAIGASMLAAEGPSADGLIANDQLLTDDFLNQRRSKSVAQALWLSHEWDRARSFDGPEVKTCHGFWWLELFLRDQSPQFNPEHWGKPMPY